MDPILKALRDYRLNASPEQKAEDLARLERECLSTIDADAYISSVNNHVQFRGSDRSLPDEGSHDM